MIARGTRDDQGIGLHSGATGVGDLTVTGNLKGRAILLVAGDGTDEAEGGRHRSRDTITDEPTHASPTPWAPPHPRCSGSNRTRASRPTRALLPSNAQFGGGSVENMEYRLESADGEVTLESGAAARFNDSNSWCTGRPASTLGSEPLTLEGLVAKTSRQHDGLHAGHGQEQRRFDPAERRRDGTGQLAVDSKLTADNIDLRAAGVGDFAGWKRRERRARGRCELRRRHRDRAQTLRPGPGRIARSGEPADPRQLRRNRRAPPQGHGPRAALAGRPALARRIRRSSQNTVLPLEGRDGVDIEGTLDLESLDAKGPLTTDESIETTGDLSVDTTVAGIERGVTLNGTATSGAVDQSSWRAARSRSRARSRRPTGGDINLASGKALTVGDVSTAHTAATSTSTTIGDTKTGVLDASGTSLTNSERSGNRPREIDRRCGRDRGHQRPRHERRFGSGRRERRQRGGERHDAHARHHRRLGRERRLDEPGTRRPSGGDAGAIELTPPERP